MASIKKRNGKWSVRVSYYEEFGKRTSKNKGGFTLKKDAEKWANQLEQQKFNKSIGEMNNNLTFYDYYANWLETYKLHKLAPVTVQEYRYTLHQVKDWLGDTKLSDMTRPCYQKFLNDFTHGNDEQRTKRKLTGDAPYHSKASVEKLHGHIHAAVIDAAADGLIRSDFCLHAELGGHQGKDAQLKYLDADDMEKLANEVNRNVQLTSTSKSMIYTGLMTGMHVSKVSALTWPDIDWKTKTISVNKSWDYVYDQKFKRTKTESSIRTITVTNELLNHLKQLHALQIASSLDNPDHMVFLNNRGRIPTPVPVTYCLKIS